MSHYSPAQRNLLLRLAVQAIDHGLRQGNHWAPDPADYPEALGEPRACFITLNIHGQLRGCIGSLEARRPLLVDVANNAYAAAFSDPRFPPLSRSEFPELEVHISVLTPAQPMQVSDEADLLAQLQVGVDGLILEEVGHRATFLPSVWAELADKREFVLHLKHKAGLPSGYWSPTLRWSRYQTESFGAAVSELD